METKHLCGVVSYKSILQHQVIRLAEAVGYQSAMRRAKVPEKNIRKILRPWLSAWAYACRKELRALVKDMTYVPLTPAEKRQTYWAHSVGPGWQRELVDPFLEVWRLAPVECEITQIKEKFGGLRIYISGPDWWQKLADAVAESAKGMCEDCGKRNGWTYGGDPKAEQIKVENRPSAGGGWWRSLCQHCRAKEEVDGDVEAGELL